MARYKSREEKDAEREAARKAAQTKRGENRKTMHARARAFEARARNALKNCGLTNMQIANFSGLDHSTVIRFMKGRHRAVRMESVVALMAVAGYDLKLEEISPKRDVYRSLRRLPPPPIVE